MKKKILFGISALGLVGALAACGTGAEGGIPTGSLITKEEAKMQLTEVATEAQKDAQTDKNGLQADITFKQEMYLTSADTEGNTYVEQATASYGLGLKIYQGAIKANATIDVNQGSGAEKFGVKVTADATYSAVAAKLWIDASLTEEMGTQSQSDTVKVVGVGDPENSQYVSILNIVAMLNYSSVSALLPTLLGGYVDQIYELAAQQNANFGIYSSGDAANRAFTFKGSMDSPEAKAEGSIAFQYKAGDIAKITGSVKTTPKDPSIPQDKIEMSGEGLVKAYATTIATPTSDDGYRAMPLDEMIDSFLGNNVA